MKTIYKYQIPITEVFILNLPAGAIPLVAKEVGAYSYLWVEVERDNLLEDVVFYIVGTGHPKPDMATKYISTIFSGIFVWHLYY